MRDLDRIATDMANQDNMATAHPLYVIEKRRTIYGIDSAYSDEFVWVCTDDGEPVDEEIASLLNTAADDTIHTDYRKVYVMHVWEFVTVCLTEKGCEDYLTQNGHNLPNVRMFVYSAWRNDEMQTIQEFVSRQRRVTDGEVSHA